MGNMFRDLYAEEIDVRIDEIKDGWCRLLLYKNARVDMDILDETVGAMNWQRKHSRENANCAIGIYDTDKKEWVWKEDTGTESNTEKEKGLASDSFKRAGTNWGIGRELYTAPTIIINCETTEKNGRYYLKSLTKFNVSAVDINAKIIIGLEINAYDKVQKSTVTVFSFGTLKHADKAEKTANAPVKKANENELPFPTVETKSQSQQIAEILIKQEYIDRLKNKVVEIYGRTDFDSLNDYQFGVVKKMAIDFKNKVKE